jgi:hypothetical protein
MNAVQFYCVLDNDKHQAFQGPFSSIETGEAFIKGEDTTGTIYSVVKVATIKWRNTGELA